MAMATNEPVGNLRVELLYRIGTNESQSLGSVSLPIRPRQMQANHLDIDLDELFDSLKAMIHSIYDKDEE